MKKIFLSQGKVALVDDADFEWVSKWKWCVAKDENRWYAVRNVYSGGRQHRVWMHREINKTPKGRKTDHQDGNTLNNSRANLRTASDKENSYSFKHRAAGFKSQFRGVCWHSKIKKWRASVRASGKRIWLGWFDSEFEAAKARDIAAFELHGVFTQLNFPV